MFNLEPRCIVSRRYFWPQLAQHPRRGCTVATDLDYLGRIKTGCLSQLERLAHTQQVGNTENLVAELDGLTTAEGATVVNRVAHGCKIGLDGSEGFAIATDHKRKAGVLSA